MHHLIFSSKDTYITNKTDYESKNFGIDEILRIGSVSQTRNVRLSQKTYNYPTLEYLTCFSVDFYVGTLTGSFSGSSIIASGSIVGTGMFTSSYFSGSLTGSISGSITGSSFYNTSYTGSVSGFSGSISASSTSVNGYITGSIISQTINVFTGYLSGSSGVMTGYISGSNIANEKWYDVKENKIIDRALLQFDLTSISQSISDGSITNPQFKLKLKVAKEEELPLQYKIHAFPVSQSWEMGNGYFSDGGSNTGASWNWRDYYSGSIWYPITSSDYSPTLDYLNTSSYSTSSFNRGGGTWYYIDGNGNSVACSQSFNYQTSDISMDVTRIVQSWISGSLPNEGFILMNSTENTSGSNGVLTFFSRDTNTIYSPVLDVMWDDSSWITGSITTSSIEIQTTSSGITALSTTGSTFSIAGGISGYFTASSFIQTSYLNTSSYYATGIVSGIGTSGNIIGIPILGEISGTLSLSSSIVTGPCGNSFTSSFLSASFINGAFSGSSFGAYYVDYQLENAFLTGSWTTSSILSSSVSIPIPSGIEPYAYAYVDGPYIDGKAIGTYTTSGSNSGSFYGQFIDGNFIGGILNIQLTGSVFTASYSQTGSITYLSSSLQSLNTQVPFVAVVQNLKPTYKSGNITRINIFGREEFALKNFNRQTQLSQYLTPKYLPSSSYYSIKDNETEEIIVDFDNYTRLSCDTYGNYFLIDTTAFAQERKYDILIKVQTPSGSNYVFDNGNTFKIIR